MKISAILSPWRERLLSCSTQNGWLQSTSSSLHEHFKAKWLTFARFSNISFWKRFIVDEMSRLTQQSGDDSRYILVAKLDNARNLLNILKAVHFKEVGVNWFFELQEDNQAA